MPLPCPIGKFYRKRDVPSLFPTNCLYPTKIIQRLRAGYSKMSPFTNHEKLEKNSSVYEKMKAITIHEMHSKEIPE